MRDRIADFSDADRAHLELIGKSLAEFGFGIFMPHKHDVEGKVVPLSLSEVSIERNLKVGFASLDEVPSDVEAVGWRFADGRLQVFAGCCGNDGPP
jgi:hypothetical protein